MLCIRLGTLGMDHVLLVLMTMLCITNTKACDLKQLCTLNLFYVLFLHCNINVSSTEYGAHVEYSRLFQYGCYNLVSEQVDSDRALGHLNAILEVVFFESRIVVLIVVLVGSDQFDLNMTVRTKCPENGEDEADQELIGMLKKMSLLMLICGHR